MRSVISIISIAVILSGCAGTLKQTGDRSITFTDLSRGLPKDGLWRQNLVLADMNGDGFPDIVAPPPRKAEPAMKRPSVFLWDPAGEGWLDGGYTFPPLEDYNYGSVAVGDVNRDGRPDIALASHGERVILLLGDGKRGFVEGDFPVRRDFGSRTLALSDINGDGWLDITALSEAPGQPGSSEEDLLKGILTGINREGKGWEVRVLEESDRFFGDSMAVTDINGDGLMDILVAPMTTIKTEKKILWLGDGRGGFEHYSTGFIGDLVASSVGCGDIDGDGRDEAVFKLSEIGKGARVLVRAFRWSGEDLEPVASSGPDPGAEPLVFDLEEIDGEPGEELILLSMRGLHVYRYTDGSWVELGYRSIPREETKGAYGLTAARLKDGTVLVVYNLGLESGRAHGIRAYRVEMK